uniref:Uncharacterized protein n=1 Tax=Cucumis sativus TaxID=3659 RepID=A0A0A0LGP1_CUCSA
MDVICSSLKQVVEVGFVGVARDQPLKISQPFVHGSRRSCSVGGGGDSGGGGVFWEVKKLYPSSP